MSSKFKILGFNIFYLAFVLTLSLVVGGVCGFIWRMWGLFGLCLVLLSVFSAIGKVVAYFSCRRETVNGHKWSYSLVAGHAKVIAFSPHGGVVSIPAKLGNGFIVSIEKGVFSGCRNLTGVTIPSSVTRVGEAAFKDCSGLLSVTIPDSVTSVGNQSFENCSSLASVAIPDTVTSIGERAFHGCSGLADAEGFVIVRNVLYSYHGAGGSVTIPDGVTSIGDLAFENRSDLTSVTIPDSVLNIGSAAFRGCSGIVSFTVGKGNHNYLSLDGLLLSRCSAGMNLVKGVNRDVVIPNGVVCICDDAFSDCVNLKSVTIPDSVTTIGTGAFFNCGRLTSIAMPNSVASIGDWTFSGCGGFTSVTIPSSVTSIGDGAFIDCKNLTSVVFNGDAPDLGCLPPSFEESCTLYVRRGADGWEYESDYNVQYINET